MAKRPSRKEEGDGCFRRLRESWCECNNSCELNYERKTRFTTIKSSHTVIALDQKRKKCTLTLAYQFLLWVLYSAALLSPLVKAFFKPQGIYRAFTKECFHSRGQQVCKFIATKDSVYIRKEFNSQRTGLGHQHGGGDVKWKGPIRISKLVPRVLCERKTLDNNDLNQVVASSGFSENKGLDEVLSLVGL